MINPTTEKERHIARQTLVIHAIPDPGTIVECLDGSNMYPPVEGLGYAQQQYNTFGMFFYFVSIHVHFQG